MAPRNTSIVERVTEQELLLPVFSSICVAKQYFIVGTFSRPSDQTYPFWIKSPFLGEAQTNQGNQAVPGAMYICTYYGGP